jgi:hypothetical protein
VKEPAWERLGPDLCLTGLVGKRPA